MHAGADDCAAPRRYQGQDWRDPHNWGCNNKKSPVGEGLFGGNTLSLHDLVFVKVKSALLASGDSTAMLASKYSMWMSQDRNITANALYEARLEGR